MKKVSINELMGSTVAGGKKEIGLSDLEELLGERMPQLDRSPVGRLRLISALRNRFGDNYRQLKGIDKIIKEFDEEVSFNVKLQKMKMIKGKKNG